MTDTLILLFHPDFSRSKANAALVAAAARVPGANVVDIAARYPSGQLDMFEDGGVEARRLIDARRIVLQFPIQWYAAPAILRAWQDAVLTRMFYVKAEEGAAMAGKSVMLAVTAGNTADAYTPGGRNLFAIETLLAPFDAMANRCGFVMHRPHVVYEADKLTAGQLADIADGYVRHLEGFIAADGKVELTEA
jgi:glutathione-regulated potassium-efflux system ancillary protein KefG